MKHTRPLKPEEAQALAAIDRDLTPMREEIERELYRLERARPPDWRLALERVFFRQLLEAVRRLPYRSRALQRIVDRIPHASSALEWQRLALEERITAAAEASTADLPGDLPPST